MKQDTNASPVAAGAREKNAGVARFSRSLAALMVDCCAWAKTTEGPPPGGLTLLAEWSAPRIGIAGRASAQGEPLREVCYGALLAGANRHIIVLNGAGTIREWIVRPRDSQVPFDPLEPARGRIQIDLALQYRLIAPQIRATLPEQRSELLLTGHGVGGALAVVVAAGLALRAARVYCFGAPRAGDETFARFYEEAVPNTFQVVNEVDPAPVLPPSPVFGSAYRHVGQGYHFHRQTGSLMRNHAIETYAGAIHSGKLRADHE